VARTTLSTKGQIVLPQSIRAQLGLVPGSELEVTTEGDVIILKRPSRFPPVTLEEAMGSVSYEGPARTVEEMNEGVARMIRVRAGKK